jgi:hypothetical protein
MKGTPEINPVTWLEQKVQEQGNKIERLREAINKVIKKMEGKGMGDWPEAKILAKALKEDE